MLTESFEVHFLLLKKVLSILVVFLFPPTYIYFLYHHHVKTTYLRSYQVCCCLKTASDTINKTIHFKDIFFQRTLFWLKMLTAKPFILIVFLFFTSPCTQGIYFYPRKQGEEVVGVQLFGVKVMLIFILFHSVIPRKKPTQEAAHVVKLSLELKRLLNCQNTVATCGIKDAQGNSSMLVWSKFFLFIKRKNCLNL